MKCYQVPKVEQKWQTLLEQWQKKGWWGHYLNDRDVLKRKDFLISSSWNREKILDWLVHENKQPSLLQQKMLAKVTDKNSLFVITGQQPHILGCPLFCLYKAITAVVQAKKWQQELAVPVIPIFWIAGDDSDGKECGTLQLQGKQYSFLNERAQIPMSEYSLQGFKQQLILLVTPLWNKHTLEALHSCFKGANTITDLFKNTLSFFLNDLGLLFVDGHSGYFKELSRPFMREDIITSSREFEKHLFSVLPFIEGVPQVKLRKNHIHAFEMVGRERKQLLNDNYHESRRYSHNVLSRPFLIDRVFPTLAHVLGPSETGYFLQLKQVFDNMIGSKPLIVPRLNGWYMNQSQLQQLQSLDIELNDFSSLTMSTFRKKWINKKIAPIDMSAIKDYEKKLFQQLHKKHNLPLVEQLMRGINQKTTRFEQSVQRQQFNTMKQDYLQEQSQLELLCSFNQERCLNIWSLFNTMHNNNEFKNSLNQLQTVDFQQFFILVHE